LGEEKNLLPLPGIETRFLGCPARSVVTITTTLSRLYSIVGIDIRSWGVCRKPRKLTGVQQVESLSVYELFTATSAAGLIVKLLLFFIK
jgi:hypothetical protein